MNMPTPLHHGTTSPRRRSPLMWMAALVMLFAVACGDASSPHSEQSGSEQLDANQADASDPPDQQFDVPTPEPGQRYFDAPEGPYFDDPRIKAVSDDPEERGPLVLADNVYWLDDSHAHTMVEHGPEQLVFPLEGNRAMLGYKPGHILLNKYWMIRHHIEAIEVRGERIYMTTRIAKFDEVAEEASFFLEIKPGTPYPIAFDMMDVYLYPDRRAQEEDIRKRVLQLEELKPKNLGLLGVHMKKIPQVVSEDQDLIRVRRQALSCDFPPHCSAETNENDCNDQQGCAWDPDASSCNKVNEAQDCSDYVKDNLEEYHPLISEAQGSGCYDAANDDASACACAWASTEQACVTEVCENGCGFNITGEEETSSGGPGRSGCVQFCLNTGHDEDKCVDSCTTAKMDFPISLVPPYCFINFKPSQCGGGCEWVGTGGPDTPWYNTDLQPCQKKTRPPIDLVLRPLFTLEAGVKAKVSWKIWKPKFVFQIGAYVRLGYGANLALEIMQTGASQGGNGRVYFSDITGSALAKIPVVFWTLDVDPYITFGFSGQAGIGGGLEWEWYKEKWFYFCMEMGTNGFDSWAGEDGSSGGDSARSTCGLPSPDDADGTEDDDDSRDLQAEAQVRATAGVGVEVRPTGAPKNNGLYLEPLVANIDLTASLRPPRCTWSYYIFFVGRFGIRLDLPVIGRQDFSKTLNYPESMDIYNEGLFDIAPFTMLGCGAYDPPPAYAGEMPGCATDDDCAPGNERCFLGRCVEHDSLRVSLGWNDNGIGGDQNLDVQVMSPTNQMYSSAMSNSTSLSTQNMTGVEEAHSLYVDNITFDDPTEGNYEFWVGMASGQPPTSDIPFTLEVETGGYVTTRQRFTGTVQAGGDALSPTSFQLCAPESNESLCDDLGLCGYSTATDACGREREMDCGFCSLKPGDSNGQGGWFQGGDPSAGNWDVAADFRSVHQKINGQPTMYVSAQDFIDRRMQGTFRVQQGAGDDDWIGFVFGYQAPLSSGHGPNSSGQYDYDAYLFAWKKRPQNGASEGFTLARVEGWDPIKWSMAPSAKFDVLATDYGSGKGWQEGRDYVLELVYETDRIRINVNGSQVFDVLAADAGVSEFPEGRFGFFNYSQADVIYSNFRADAL